MPKPFLGEIEYPVREPALHCFSQDVLALAVPALERGGQAPGELHHFVIEEGRANLEIDHHGGSIDLGQDAVLKIEPHIEFGRFAGQVGRIAGVPRLYGVRIDKFGGAGCSSSSAMSAGSNGLSHRGFRIEAGCSSPRNVRLILKSRLI